MGPLVPDTTAAGLEAAQHGAGGHAGRETALRGMARTVATATTMNQTQVAMLLNGLSSCTTTWRAVSRHG
jgi:hypothetical protein